MLIQSTADLSLDKLRQAAGRLPADWKAEVDEGQMFMRALEVPSWITIVAKAPWWVQFLGGAASVYVSGILSEAGKDTWKNRGTALDASKRVRSAVSRMAELVFELIAAGTQRTFVMLALPLANGFDELKLKLDYQSQDELEFEIALFVHFVPQIEALIQSEEDKGAHAVGGMLAEFGRNDFSLLVSWLDRESLTRKEVQFELRRAASQETPSN